MSLLLTGAGQQLTSILNPLLAARMARQLGRDYLLIAGALGVLGVVHLGALGLALGLRLLNLFIISRVLSEALSLVVPFTAAHVVGLLLYVRGDTLGYGAARDYLEPVLGDTGPRLAAPAMRDEALLPGAGSHEEGPAKGAGEQLSALAAAVEARDVPQALALYASLRQLPGVSVPPAHHLFIGQAAAVEGNFPLAVQALERAADVAPDEPTAPRALVLLARVLGERMHDVARAEEVYRYVLHRYPDTSAAAYARERVPHVSSD
jgi:tetratricopeptide (TPR) repeat protein